VAALDAALGRFLEGLEQRRQLDTLMLVVTGTRGERLDERPGPVGAHGIDLYDASLRVPLLVRLPAHHLGGQLTDRLAMSADLAPTLAEFGLHQDWEGTRGESLGPVLRARKPVHATLFAQGRVVAEDGESFEGYALLTELEPPSKSFKLVTDASGARAVATMRLKDPGERNGFSVSPADFAARTRADPWWPDCVRP
jgi:hypothetical protein